LRAGPSSKFRAIARACELSRGVRDSGKSSLPHDDSNATRGARCLLTPFEMSRIAQSAAIWAEMVGASTRRVRAELAAGRSATLEAELLHTIDSPGSSSDTRFVVADGSGQRFLLEIASRQRMEAERAAFELRELAQRPTIFAAFTTIRVQGLGRVRGLLKPYFDVATEELDTDTTRWTDLQRSVMLLEHAWEWMLDELECGTRQYALFDPDAYPLNIDWSRAYSSDARSELSRFEAFGSGLPSARTFLYSDYVEGRIELPFSLLLREARRISRLPELEVRRILTRFARVRHRHATDARQLVERALDRRRRIEWEMSRFVRELELERMRLIAIRPLTLIAWGRNALGFVRDQWQLAGMLRLRSDGAARP